MVQYCSFIQHRYHTRQRKNEKLYIPKVKTSLGKVCISYLGSIFWNDLSMEIRKKTSRSSFRSKVVKDNLLEK